MPSIIPSIRPSIRPSSYPWLTHGSIGTLQIAFTMLLIARISSSIIRLYRAARKWATGILICLDYCYFHCLRMHKIVSFAFIDMSYVSARNTTVEEGENFGHPPIGANKQDESDCSVLAL